jgi:hypothetical protein
MPAQKSWQQFGRYSEIDRRWQGSVYQTVSVDRGMLRSIAPVHDLAPIWINIYIRLPSPPLFVPLSVILRHRPFPTGAAI